MGKPGSLLISSLRLLIRDPEIYGFMGQNCMNNVSWYIICEYEVQLSRIYTATCKVQGPNTSLEISSIT